MLSERERAEDHYLNSVGHFIETAKSEGIEQGRAIGLAEGESKGRAIGLAEGEVKGQIRTIITLYRTNAITLDIACQTLNLSVDEFKQLLEEN